MQSTGEQWRLGRRSALDGLRGIAVLLVVLGHALLHGFKTNPGQTAEVGVAIFFALSGFLITALLLEERDRTGRTSMRSFYLRRARRLFPALATFLGILAALATAFTYRLLAAPSDFIATALYVQNWHLISGADYSGLSHAWSLSIEEQFYIVWPVAFIGLARFGRHVLGYAAAAGILAAVGLRLILWNGGAGAERVYFGTDTRADNLLIGCLLAVVVSSGTQRVARPTIGVACLAVTVALGLVVSPLWLPTLVATGTVATIALIAQPGSGGLFRWLPLRWFGARSYALYLWHMPLFWMFGPTPWWLAVPLALTLSLVAAEASWRFVERPFLYGDAAIAFRARQIADVGQRGGSQVLVVDHAPTQSVEPLTSD
jgi:peptidoglycan/LPS O-acetylase OafA/YrhL